jgi:hypothetical protein
MENFKHAGCSQKMKPFPPKTPFYHFSFSAIMFNESMFFPKGLIQYCNIVVESA